MRLHALILAPLVLMASLIASPTASSPDKPATPPSPQEAALEKLLAERESPAALEGAIANARKQGVSEQAVLEARFLFHVDRHEDDALAAMLPDLLKQNDAFKIEDSAIFGVKEDWLAIIEYVKAITALHKGDKDAFKQHITEAFWLSPRQGAAFAQHIERVRLDEAMRSVKIDFATKLKPLATGDAVTLEKLIAERKALLFHFWSPLSRECEAGMPDFITTATTLSANGIAVVSLLPEEPAQLLTDARAMLRPLGTKLPGAWLLDPKDHPLARTLRIQDLPAMVLVATDGKILFNGDPSDNDFWDALHKIDPRITRPKSPRDNKDE